MFETAWTTEPYEQVCHDRVAVFSEAERSVIVATDGFCNYVKRDEMVKILLIGHVSPEFPRAPQPRNLN